MFLTGYDFGYFYYDRKYCPYDYDWVRDPDTTRKSQVVTATINFRALGRERENTSEPD